MMVSWDGAVNDHMVTFSMITIYREKAPTKVWGIIIDMIENMKATNARSRHLQHLYHCFHILGTLGYYFLLPFSWKWKTGSMVSVTFEVGLRMRIGINRTVKGGGLFMVHAPPPPYSRTSS